MALNPWMTALQAALGGAAGGFGGYAQDKARMAAEDEAKAEKERQARLDEETRKRQALSDTLAVINAGGMERGARQQALTQAAPAAFDTAKNAMAMMRNEPFRYGTELPAQITQQGVQSLQGAAGQFGAPAASFDVGGKTFDITQTPLQRSMMLAEQEAQRTKQTEAERRATLKAEQDAERKRLTTITALARSGNKEAKDELLATNPQAYEKLFPSRAPRQANVVFDKETGQTVNLDTGKATKVEGYQPKAMKFPEAAAKRVEGYEFGIAAVQNVKDMLTERKNSVGLLKGYTPTAILDWADPDGVAVRAAIEALAGEIRNARFGGALTSTEAAFAEKMLPGTKSTADAAQKKLDQLTKYLEGKRKATYTVHRVPYEPMNVGDLSDNKPPTPTDSTGAPKNPSGIQEW
jgi:hypothetical protein